MNVCRLASLLAIVLSHTATLSAQSPNTPFTVVFANTTNEPVNIFFVDANQEERIYVENLDANKQVEQESYVGQVWKIVGATTALYQAVPPAPGQDKSVVDVKELISWQSPVQLVFQNTTDQPVDVYWVTPEGVEESFAPGLPADKQYLQRRGYPLQLWRIRQGSKIIAEYVPDRAARQEIDIASLASAYRGCVELILQNTTEDSIDLFWVNLQGDEMSYAAEIPAGKQHEQLAYPGQLWRVRPSGQEKGELPLLEYIPTSDAKQVIDLAKVLAALKAPPSSESVAPTPPPAANTPRTPPRASRTPPKRDSSKP